jgi:hypothetical protein
VRFVAITLCIASQRVTIVVVVVVVVVYFVIDSVRKLLDTSSYFHIWQGNGSWYFMSVTVDPKFGTDRAGCS